MLEADATPKGALAGCSRGGYSSDQELRVASKVKAKKTEEHPLSAKTASEPEVLASTVDDHSHPKDHPMESAEAPTTAGQPPSTTSASPPHDESELSQSSEGESEHGNGGGQGGAYNPETGEINWDCPCLGGMAHGPCGPQFREAFSCFIYSDAEPKGIECVEKFKGMQDCFREHPEIYAEGKPR
jgi:intermembrane space import and assembly protein 40